MKLRTLIGTTVAALALAIPATNAAAASGWSWTEGAADETVAGSTLHWSNDLPDYITYADCTGRGSSFWENGYRYFKKFSCYVETADYESYIIRITVKGEYAFAKKFVRYA